MSTLGIIHQDRLMLMPPQYWAAHEFCFRMHDQIAELLVQYEASGAHNWVIDAFKKVLDQSPSISGEINILQVMKEKKLVGMYKHHIVSHLVLGLTSDMLHFIYEALICFEKRKFAVGYALLRKPLKENLLFLVWILADLDDFITRFEADNYRSLNGSTEEQRLKLFSKAIARLTIKDSFDPSSINSTIYSKTNAEGFEPIWQRASHLVTSQGALLKTEDYNINFIFNNPASDHHYEFLYSELPRIMIFTVQVTLECFALFLQANEKTVSHLIISTMGCYEALFLPSRKQPVAHLLNKHFKPFLKCIHCEAPLRITKKNAPSAYLHEKIVCKTCGLPSDFPFYWLMAMAKMTISREGSLAPFLELD